MERSFGMKGRLDIERGRECRWNQTEGRFNDEDVTDKGKSRPLRDILIVFSFYALQFKDVTFTQISCCWTGSIVTHIKACLTVWQEFTPEWFFLQVVLNCSTVDLSSNFHHGSSAQRRSDSNKRLIRALTQWGQVLQQRYKGASSNHGLDLTCFSSGASAEGPSWW